MAARASWRGVFPAVTTQFDADFSVDAEATARTVAALVEHGVSGVVVGASLGENTALGLREKMALVEAAVAAADGRVPVLAGVAEYNSALAASFAGEAERAGAAGLLALPPLGYAAKPREIVGHFETIAGATGLPIMLDSSPLLHRADITPAVLKGLADVDSIVAVKESSGDTRRVVDIRNLLGDRFTLFCGLDDVVLESVALGAEGWVSGLSNVFVREAETLFRLAASGRLGEARALYDWFMPLLHLDARPDLVQAIKLCQKILGHGSERTRPPRLPLDHAEVAEIEALMGKALSRRPELPDVGLPQAA